ncbi:hypothetical protein DFH11DRAFT_1503314 [Phellopilus nigrolimitatus]|nr:hypothetical protein DFH11DRAFT_1503314 [Phellopilus nigrolimitatus]
MQPTSSPPSSALPSTPTRRRVLNIDPTLRTPPLTPKRPSNTSIDPSQYTPSKRMRLMVGSLAMSDSGSFLVSRTKMNCTYAIAPPVLEQTPNLPEPDWSLTRSTHNFNLFSRNELEERARKLTNSLNLAQRHVQVSRSINEAANAQLIVQDLYASKLKVALGEKEKGRSKDKTRMFEDGHGKVFTSNDVVAFITDKEKAKEQETEDAAERAKVRLDKRAAKEFAEKQWEEIKAKHTAAVAQWEANCKQWTEEGKPKKLWNPKPKRTKKPLREELEATALLNAQDGGRPVDETSVGADDEDDED